MSRETRQSYSERLKVLKTIQGHDNTVAHGFNHTGGRCPKCARNNLALCFCHPRQENKFAVRGCELDGEHLHVLCTACKYVWIERTWDQAMLAEERGEAPAESEIACVLVAVAKQHGGITLNRESILAFRQWKILFSRNQEDGTVTVTVAPPDPQTGEIVHPSPESMIEMNQNQT